MFQDATGVTITGGTFQVQAGVKDWKSEGLQILKPRIAPGAFHNSAERSDPPKCYPNTRKGALDKIMTWVKDKRKLTLFMWMHGPAGTGKSAIAQSIADLCAKDGRGGSILAASFFFCRTAPERNDGSKFIPTIVYQLMISIPEVAWRVGIALVQDPLLLSRSLEAQIKALVVDPLNDAAVDETDGPLLRTRPNLIIIDGLDECSDSGSQRNLLVTLLSAAEDLSVPLYFLISSRPEPRIRDTFNDPTWSSMSIHIALDDSYQPEDGIRHYLQSHFEQIRRKHPSLPKSWPSRSQLQALVHNSSGQFIYVSTVMKYLSDSQSSSMPQDRLDHILGLTTSHGEGATFVEIDNIYHHILSTVSERDIDRVSDILTFLLMVDFWSKTKTLIEAFFGYRKGEVDLIVNDVHSLIRVPSNGDPDEELRITHSSTLSDFLFDQSRSGKFFINAREAHGRLTGICLNHLKNDNSPLVQDPEDVHHLRSLLMVNCVESDLSARVIIDLYNVDLKKHLNFWYSTENVIGLYEHDMKRIVSFISWFKTHDQRHPKYATDLFSHHQQTIDNWIKIQLDSYPRVDRFDEFLIAGTITNFLSEEMFVILGIEKTPRRTFTLARRPDPLQIYSCNREFSDFYTILTDFLSTEERAREYFIHERSFVLLALVFLSYLQVDDARDTDTLRHALDLFPKVLLRCSKSSNQLSYTLLSHKLSQPPKHHELFYVQKLLVQKSIKQYLSTDV